MEYLQFNSNRTLKTEKMYNMDIGRWNFSPEIFLFNDITYDIRIAKILQTEKQDT